MNRERNCQNGYMMPGPYPNMMYPPFSGGAEDFGGIENRLSSAERQIKRLEARVNRLENQSGNQTGTQSNQYFSNNEMYMM